MARQQREAKAQAELVARLRNNAESRRAAEMTRIQVHQNMNLNRGARRHKLTLLAVLTDLIYAKLFYLEP